MSTFKILLALGAPESSKRVVEYIVRLAALGLTCDVTLFHVLKVPGSLSKYGPAGDKIEQALLDGLLTEKAKRELQEIRRDANQSLFDPAEEVLLATGSLAGVHRKFGPELQTDVAAAILDEAGKNSYDAIVLSRRRQSAVADMVLGSVTSKVVHHLRGTAVWLIEP